MEILFFILGILFFSFATVAVVTLAIVYFLMKRFKVAFLSSIVIFIISIVVFIVSLVGFIGMAGSAGGLATVSSGMARMQRNNLVQGVWSFEAETRTGFVRRTPQFTQEHLSEISVRSRISGGSAWIEFEQGQTRLHVDLYDGLSELLDLREFGFEEGRVRVNLRFEGASNVAVLVDWGP